MNLNQLLLQWPWFDFLIPTTFSILLTSFLLQRQQHIITCVFGIIKMMMMMMTTTNIRFIFPFLYFSFPAWKDFFKKPQLNQMIQTGINKRRIQYLSVCLSTFVTYLLGFFFFYLLNRSQYWQLYCLICIGLKNKLNKKWVLNSFRYPLFT